MRSTLKPFKSDAVFSDSPPAFSSPCFFLFLHFLFFLFYWTFSRFHFCQKGFHETLVKRKYRWVAEQDFLWKFLVKVLWPFFESCSFRYGLKIFNQSCPHGILMVTGASWLGVNVLRILWNVNFRLNYNIDPVEACVSEWLTPRTPDLEVWSSSLACHVVSLDKELYSTLSLFTQVYKWVPATYCFGVTLLWTSILSRGESQYL